MDTLTHALSGALLARATAPRKASPDALPLSRRVFIGFVAAAVPDLDFVTSYISPITYLYHHRGVTHSLLLLPLWAVLLSFVFAALWRFKPGWRAYFGVIALGLGVHIAGDWITSFGTMLLAPLSDRRFELSTTFIIDLWFTGIILAGLVASLVFRRSRVPATAGLVILAGYVGFQWLMQQQAIAAGEEYARKLGVQAVSVNAVPRPPSPFNWTVFVAEDGRYHYAHINLVRSEPRPDPGPDAGLIAQLDAPYRPVARAQWIVAERFGRDAREAALAREVFEHERFHFFRWFAAYPVALDVERGEQTCAWFHDLRFVTPGRGGTPFRYGMCRTRDEDWQIYRIAGGSRVPL